MRQTLKKVYYTIFPNFIDILEKEMSDCKTVLDVGCGAVSPLKFVKKNGKWAGVDAFKPSIAKSKKEKIHDEYYNIDVLAIGKQFKANSFDCVVALDLIEHLKKKDGLKLLEMMERIAKKKVIIFTPNGFQPQGEYDNNPWQVHHSGWEVEEMQKRGYKVIGINGWKPLRGEYAKIKYKPTYFWRLISDMTYLVLKKYPKHSFQILCVKKIE